MIFVNLNFHIEMELFCLESHIKIFPIFVLLNKANFIYFIIVLFYNVYFPSLNY